MYPIDLLDLSGRFAGWGEEPGVGLRVRKEVGGGFDLEIVLQGGADATLFTLPAGHQFGFETVQDLHAVIGDPAVEIEHELRLQRRDLAPDLRSVILLRGKSGKLVDLLLPLPLVCEALGLEVSRERPEERIVGGGQPGVRGGKARRELEELRLPEQLVVEAAVV